MATSKKIKAVRGPQYEKILADVHNLSMKDCCIMGFKFKNLSESYSFHYSIMNNKVDYLIYDGATERVKVILKTENQELKTLASTIGGEYYKPSILNDYE